MAYTQIMAQVNDQALQLTNVPKLASGGVYEIRVSFAFCDLWAGATDKTAVFYRDKTKVYHEELTGDACVAPFECFAEPGVVYMGVFANYEGGQIRTSEVLPLEVVQGAITVESASSAPVITFDQAFSSAADDPTQMESGAFTVSGTAYDEDNAITSFTVNGEAVAVNADGTWSTELNLSEGQIKEITVVAVDGYGNTTTKRRYVVNAVECTIVYANRARVGYTGAEGENLVIPATFYDEGAMEWNRVTSIGAEAFKNCTNLASVTIPGSVANIGANAFESCSALASVTIQDGVTSIDTFAFASCSALASVEIPTSVTTIGTYAFYDCQMLTSVVIPASVTSIGGYAFCNCRALTNVTNLASVTSIENGAFCECRALTSVVIPDSVTSIGTSAFASCKTMTSVVIPSSVTSIGDKAFNDCGQLTDVYYTGTAEQWAAIAIGTSNDNLTGATIHYNYAG